jgi:hypothetical protein
MITKERLSSAYRDGMMSLGLVAVFAHGYFVLGALLSVGAMYSIWVQVEAGKK